jgi:hypothetical protein
VGEQLDEVVAKEPVLEKDAKDGCGATFSVGGHRNFERLNVENLVPSTFSGNSIRIKERKEANDLKDTKSLL